MNATPPSPGRGPLPARRTVAGPAAAALAALSIWWIPAAAGSAADDPVQVIADVVLIEAQCRQLSVDYGRLFAYARQNGVDPVDVMPLGARRAAFDAATRRRARETRGEALCGALAAERDASVPGVFAPR